MEEEAKCNFSYVMTDPSGTPPPSSRSLGSANGVGIEPSLFLCGNRYRPRPHTPYSATNISSSRPQSIVIHAENQDSQENPRGETTVQHHHLPR